MASCGEKTSPTGPLNPGVSAIGVAMERYKKRGARDIDRALERMRLHGSNSKEDSGH
jgi:hypothetical protein